MDYMALLVSLGLQRGRPIIERNRSLLLQPKAPAARSAVRSQHGHVFSSFGHNKLRTHPADEDLPARTVSLPCPPLVLRVRPVWLCLLHTYNPKCQRT
jgi:hypothetical protein